MCDICACTQRCMRACMCLCVRVGMHHFFIQKILVLAMVSWKGVSVSVIVKDNHLLLLSSPPGCINILPLPSNPCTIPVAGLWDGWPSPAIDLCAASKHIFMQYVSIHFNIFILGKALFLGIFRNA